MPLEDYLGAERYTPAQAAEIAGVSLTTVHRWITTGVKGRRLESFNIGGRVYVLCSALDEFLLAGIGHRKGRNQCPQ